MKQIVIGVVSALVTAAALAAGTPAHADPLESWVEQVNRKLDRSIVFPSNGQVGVVEATFKRRGDGRAEAIVTRSGSPAMQRAARQTLTRIRDLPPLPTGYAGIPIRMQMLVGHQSELASHNKRRERMLESARAANMRLIGERAPFEVASTAAK